MFKDDAEKKLKELFNIDNFYDDQWLVIQKLFNNNRVLLIQKTGYGKSLCFQFPAIFFDGVTIVFSPLIALMRDQVNKLKSLGIKAELINYQQEEFEINNTLELAKNNKIKILYISPERLGNSDWQNAVNFMKISMVVVDEAHCISTWGHDFRLDYQRIINIVKLMPQNFPILATTATATKRVEKDIQSQIGSNTQIIRGSLVRKNLALNVIHLNSEDEKMLWLLQYLPNLEGNGIIYTGTRASAEVFCSWLIFNGINCVYYHAGLNKEERLEIENGMMTNKYKCIVSTNALGMGIDKNDIHFIIHTQITQSPVHYYQEIGRAGRDGKKSNIFLLYNKNEDLKLPQAFIENARPSIHKYYKVINTLKNEMLGLTNIVKKTNIKQNQVQIILADLIEQKIINKIFDSKHVLYEYRYGAKELDFTRYNELKELRTKELEEIVKYTDLLTCRMKYLCNYLDDQIDGNCGICDNDTQDNFNIIPNQKFNLLLDNFAYYPELAFEIQNTKLVNGFAASSYGVTKVGSLINKSKYQNGGDFPEELLNKLIKLYKTNYCNIKFDLVLYVPPTESGDLVKNLASSFAKITGIPISHHLIKLRQTLPQKCFESAILKTDNVKNAFDYSFPAELVNKNILLIDDVYDNGATIKEIGKLLTKYNAKLIKPIVLAKTVGGEK